MLRIDSPLSSRTWINGMIGLSGMRCELPAMDDKDLVAVREYPGCFTDNEVRQYLGQPSHDIPNHKDQLQGQGQAVTPENHWLRDCICDPFHIYCVGSPCSHETKDGSTATDEAPEDIGIHTTIDELRAASESSCWFCAVLYASILSMPSWDPAMRLRSRQEIEVVSSDNQLFLISRDKSWESLPEPPVMLYIDGNIGMKHLVRVPGSETYADRAISILLSLPSASGSAANGLR